MALEFFLVVGGVWLAFLQFLVLLAFFAPLGSVLNEYRATIGVILIRIVACFLGGVEAR